MRIGESAFLFSAIVNLGYPSILPFIKTHF